MRLRVSDSVQSTMSRRRVRRSSERKASAPGRQIWYAWVRPGISQPLRCNELHVAHTQHALRCAETTGYEFTGLHAHNAGCYPAMSTQSTAAAFLLWHLPSPSTFWSICKVCLRLRKTHVPRHSALTRLSPIRTLLPEKSLLPDNILQLREAGSKLLMKLADILRYTLSKHPLRYGPINSFLNWTAVPRSSICHSYS